MSDMTMENLWVCWGMTFRAMVIIATGVAAHLIFSPGDIFGIALSQLTLGKILGALLSITLPISSVRWFFSFPQPEFPLQESPYLAWSVAGNWVIGGCALIWIWVSQ